MFGNKLRSWMEAHLVRPRKKQQRKLNTRAKTIPEALDEAKQDYDDKDKVKSDEEICTDLGTTGCGGGIIRITREKLRDGPRQNNSGKDNGETGVLANLSSPESAYSTGYSTDGTSPGASVPPEYYINIRTGTHYVAPPPVPVPPPLTPKSAHRRAAVRPRPPLPESSTEEDIAAETATHHKPHKPLTPKSQKKLAGVVHRRTESYDECHYRGNTVSPYQSTPPGQILSPKIVSSHETLPHQVSSSHQVTSPLMSPLAVVSPPCSSPRPCASPRLCASPRQCSSPRLCGSPRPCQSPHPSMSSPLPGASPRQRNRIRTNPWHAPPHDENTDRKLLHPNTDTADSSSTLSSSDKPNYKTNDTRKQNPSSISNREVVTTCLSSSIPACRHHPLSSSSSAPSSCSDRHPNTSDFSDDDDDATLNEILGNSSDVSLGPGHDTDFIDTSVNKFQEPDRNHYASKSHCGQNGATPEVKKRQNSRPSRRQRGDNSQSSSRASSRSNRRVKRNISRKSDDVSSSSDFADPNERAGSRPQSSRDRKLNHERSPVKYPVNSCIEKITENRVANMNKVLIDRIINNQRCGTRSADTTPILKRHGPLDYNGKYLKNPHVSKLISCNSSLMERRPSLDVKSSRSNGEKRRSNSLSAHYQPPPKPIDNDGDVKCRQLIKEAEHILEDYTVRTYKPDYLSPTLSTRSAIVPCSNNNPVTYTPLNNCLNQEIQSQISLLQEKISNPLIKTDHEDGILKTISKTLERIINKNSLKSKKKSCVVVSDSQNNLVNNINLTVSPETQDFSHSPNNYRRSNTLATCTTKLNPSPPFKRSPKFETGDIDRIRPKVRGVDYIRVTDSSNYSPILPERVSPYLSPGMRARRLANYTEARIYSPPFDNKPSLTTFKSFDLRNQNDRNGQMCPLSEPVKRKVYVGSSTFGKIQKSLMRNETEPCDPSHSNTESLREENASLKEKVARLRIERLKVEARVKEAQNQIDRLNFTQTISRC